MRDEDRLHQIDAFRFAAALAVLLFHYTFRGFAVEGLRSLDFPVLGSFFRYGYLGVELFFVISGFVIFLSIQGKDAAAFTISRMTRLGPAYWAAVTATALVLWGPGRELYGAVGLGRYLVNLTMLHDFVGVEHVDGVYWTLVIELKFYFWVFVLLLARQVERVERWAWLWLAVSAASLLGFHHQLSKTLFFAEYNPLFVAGMVFFLAWRDGWNVHRGLQVGTSWVLGAGHAVRRLGGLREYYGAEFSGGVVAAAVTAIFVLFLLITAGALRGTLWKWPVWKCLAPLGALTYPLYLVHQVIGFVLLHHLEGRASKWTLLATATAVMLAAAWLIHVGVERTLAPRLKRGLNAVVG